MKPWKMRLKGNWNQLKGKIKEEWGELTDDELIYEEGKEDQLVGKIQKKTGKTAQEIETWIERNV